MDPVNIGDLVLGMSSDKEGYPKEIVGMVISDMSGFRAEYERWVVEWSDGDKSNHRTNIIRMMKEDLKRLTQENK